MQLLGALLYVLCVVQVELDLKIHQYYKLMLQWKRCDGTHAVCTLHFIYCHCHTCLCNTFGLEY